MLKEKLLMFVSSFKAASMWLHGAHYLTKGPAFIATHEMLYGRMYETLTSDFDKLVEKMIYQMNDEELGCPVLISSFAAEILKQYESPANLGEENIGMLALVLMVDHMRGVEALLSLLEQNNMLTLGMQDFLTSAYNQYESYAYMLNQQLKK